ncbi:MAG: nucleotidyltransferase domain-containing protein [Spirochaetaceae bacterium]|nr:MAG: nucleotidyltransferase domain-containing protein [Spirochaetaceae bacterium]
MRLSARQRHAIRSSVRQHFGPNAVVRLFGSRTDDTLRGGDIDLLVECPGVDPNSQGAVEAKLRLISSLHKTIGERKIDIVLAGADSDSAIVHAARQEGVPL